MTLVATLAGLGLIALAARDIFDTLFHPHGRGVVSERLIRFVWWCFGVTGRRRFGALSLAGPLAFVTVLLSWVALVTLGGALVFMPRLPDEFVVAPGLEPGQTSGFLDAIYVSLVNLTSLGFGDVVPRQVGVRLLAPIQALIGLGLLTASVSWILSIYGVIRDMRGLAREISLLCDACEAPGPDFAQLEPLDQAAILRGLTSRLISVRRDLQHFPITYYFHSREPAHALSLSLERLRELVGEPDPTARPEVAVERGRLEAAAGELLELVAVEFLRSPELEPPETLRLWQADHGW
jgi:hypothetical protein